MAEEKKQFPCFKCRDYGFPGVMVTLHGKDEKGQTIQKEPDGTPHIHRTKLASRQHTYQQQPQQQQIPMTQPLSGNSFKTAKDQDIERMHKENQDDRKAERDLMKQDIDAKLQIAIAIKALADAIKERGVPES